MLSKAKSIATAQGYSAPSSLAGTKIRYGLSSIIKPVNKNPYKLHSKFMSNHKNVECFLLGATN
ncbi:hypothetical protein OCA41_18180, partial [Bacillus cereus]|nr:hypothetical protein [Bacillus cereus]